MMKVKSHPSKLVDMNTFVSGLCLSFIRFYEISDMKISVIYVYFHVGYIHYFSCIPITLFIQMIKGFYIAINSYTN